MILTPMATVTIAMCMFVPPAYAMMKGIDLMIDSIREHPITNVKFKEFVKG